MALNGARVLVLGVAYKKNVNDIRESPGLELLDMLRARRGRRSAELTCCSLHTLHAYAYA